MAAQRKSVLKTTATTTRERKYPERHLAKGFRLSRGLVTVVVSDIPVKQCIE